MFHVERKLMQNSSVGIKIVNYQNVQENINALIFLEQSLAFGTSRGWTELGFVMPIIKFPEGRSFETPNFSETCLSDFHFLKYMG